MTPSRHSSSQTERRESCIFRSSKLFALISLHSAATCGPCRFHSSPRHIVMCSVTWEWRRLWVDWPPCLSPPRGALHTQTRHKQSRETTQNKTPSGEAHCVAFEMNVHRCDTNSGIMQPTFFLFFQGLLTSLSTHKALVLFIYLFFN